MKKIINTPERLVREMGAGIALTYPHLTFQEKDRIIRKRHLDPNKVCLISGGGSGHEPAHAGFVGDGMLDAAVCGDVFASPSQIQVYQAIRQTAGKKGTLLIIKNYSGDVMNFKNGAYLAAEDGIAVDWVLVDDDIAVKDSLYTVGRRGVAGTVFVHKIAGACAQRGASLQEVKTVAEKTAAWVRSIGFAFTSCTVPAKGTPTFRLEDGEMEYGVGIHGEPGVRRQQMVSADELAKMAVEDLLEDFRRSDLVPDQTALMINGAGATPLQELYVLNYAVQRELAARGIRVLRCFVGNYMTSIDMAGASVTLLKLDSTLQELLDEPCGAPAFPVRGPGEEISFQERALCRCEEKGEVPEDWEASGSGILSNQTISLDNLIFMVDRMSRSIIQNEVSFCEVDAHAGDGDFGASLAKGFRQLRREWRDILACPHQTMGTFLDSCAMVIMEHCGGASGPVWGAAFRSAGKEAGERTSLTTAEFAQMLQAAVEGIQRMGRQAFGRGAQAGDKTLLDALVPCAEAWVACGEAQEAPLEALRRGADAAVAGAKRTEQMVARMGRAGTVGKRSLGYPDAGAYGLGVIFSELCMEMTMED